jgi:hypothetical protein
MKDEGVVAFFTDKTEGIEVERTTEASSFEEIFTPRQKHTGKILILTEKTLKPEDIDVILSANTSVSEEIIADGVLTDKAGIMVGVKVADCVPILIYERNRKVWGVVHAGWRGTSKGILRRALKAMKRYFGADTRDILLAFGPSIRWCCYEVGSDVLNAVATATGEGEYYRSRDGKICLDLAYANMRQALKEGIPKRNFWISEECTFCSHEKFNSYRRDRSIRRQGGFIGIRR